MKIEIELSDVQLKAVNAVANKLRAESPAEALVLLAFAQMTMDFGDSEQFILAIADVAIPVIHGKLPEFPEDGICGCISLDDSATEALVPLATDDIENFCRDMASELYHDMTLTPKWKSLDEEDFAGVVAAWREHSPNYVADRLAYFARGRQRGYRGEVQSREYLEETRAMHDATADRLERLLPFLKAKVAA